MPVFFSASGKFTMDWFLSVATQSEKQEVAGGWGLAYCFGNRLEIIRSHHPRKESPEFSHLKEIRSDMATLYLHAANQILTPRTIQPFVRRERGQVWAFCYFGNIEHPEKLDTGGRYPDGPDLGELLFIHILNRFNPAEPIESVLALLSELVEPTLIFCLMSADYLVVADWCNEEREPRLSLWFGKGELLRLIATHPGPNLPGIVWEIIPHHSVLIINRERRAV